MMVPSEVAPIAVTPEVVTTLEASEATAATAATSIPNLIRTGVADTFAFRQTEIATIDPKGMTIESVGSKGEPPGVPLRNEKPVITASCRGSKVL